METYKISKNEIYKSDFKEVEAKGASQYWIIGNPEEICSHNDFFKFHASTIKECISNKQHPRVEIYDDITFGVLNVIERNHVDFAAKEINFYLAKNILVFVVKEKNKLVEGIKNEIIANTKSSDAYTINISKILYLLIDKLTSSDSTILNEIENRISAFEEQVITGSNMDFTSDVVKLRKQLLYLKRYYEPLIDLVEDLEENENNMLDEGALRYFKILGNRVQRLNNNVLNLRDYLTQVREAYQAQVDIKLNQIMKMFTVVTTIFLPLTLIAGWYGMNFRYMPELGWIYGYPFVFFLSGLVIAICIIIFKRNKLI